MNRFPRSSPFRARTHRDTWRGLTRFLNRAASLAAVIILALLVVPAVPAAACPAPSIPLYPGALPPGGPSGTSLPVNAGRVFIPTEDPLVDVQRFYALRLPNEGWVTVPQLPGQYIDQFSRGGLTPQDNIPQGVLEFSRNDGHETVRIVGEGGGYSIYADCRD
jgi:hypothetical protein